MDFSLSPELQELQQRTRAFIRDKVIPMESDRRQTHHGPTEELRRELELTLQIAEQRSRTDNPPEAGAP